MVRKSKLPIIGLVLLLGVGCGRRQAKDDAALPPAAIPVAVSSVSTGDIAEILEVTGAIQAVHDITVSSKIMGKVDRVYVKEGQSVREGQLLISLEDQDLKAQVKQAQAGLDTARARLEQARRSLGIQTQASSTEVVQAEANLEAAAARLAQAETNKTLTAQSVEAQLSGARAQLASAGALLDKVKSGAREQEKAEADAAVAQAQSALDNARANLARMTNLLSAGAVSKQQLDGAQLQYDVARSNYDMASQRRNLVYAGARSEDVASAEAQVAQARAAVAAAEANVQQNDLRDRELDAARIAVRQAEAALSLARVSTARNQISKEDVHLAEAGVAQAEAALSLAQSQLDSSRILSPVSGFVAAKMTDKGETVAPGTPLMRVVARGAVEFRAKVSETDIAKVAAGQQVTVTADALSNQTFVGSVAEVLPAAETATRAFEIRVVVPNPRDDLKEGMFARGKILLARKEQAVLLAKDAAVRDERGALHAFVVEGDTARRREISVGLEAVNKYEVISGLSAGEKVVVSGQAGLRDGDKVSVQSSPADNG